MFKARILTPEVDYASRQMVARLLITDGNYREFFDTVDKEKEYTITIKKHRKKRSLDANAYFHVLCGKIAEKIGSSLIEVKNHMIAMYGQLDLIDGGVNYLIIRDEIETYKLDAIHLQPTAQVRELNGKLYRVCAVMRGSHTYNTDEMSKLISGTITEAKEAGLTEAEIMSPVERERLREVYGI